MASSRLASDITSSAGAKMNSGVLSTNLLMSQGRLRDRPYISRVSTHLFLLWLVSCICKNEDAAVFGRDHVKPVWNDDRRRVGASGGRGPIEVTGLRIDGVDHTGIADGDVHKARPTVEEGYIGRARDRPHIRDLAVVAVQLDQRAVVAAA